ncbi:hypothetical protein GHT06_008687 [Daphnia sinensis]|uniref:Uncharacterized protein n=1 Tax=Daphnia sinensis TaxID=1820382 RepID=A0AAD5PYP6_9CRUS|nr:hypothetical protein GHT06_008687 [Daphnia sinensis]
MEVHVQALGIVTLLFLVLCVLVTPAISQREYVDKWEPFDIQNNPHVDRYESSYNKFGLPSDSLVGSIHEFIAPRPLAREIRRNGLHKKFHNFA